jgi:hypothetical protein
MKSTRSARSRKPATRSSTRSATRTNSILYATHSPFPFFFVGCWNKDSAGQLAVSNAMMTSLPRPQALFIGGDNVYPEKDSTGKKVYSLNRLERGFRQMQSLNVPMYVALGNHNIVNSDILAREMSLPWIIPNNYYCIRFRRDKLQVIILDTNLYADNTYTEQARKQDNWLSSILSGSFYESIIIQHEPLVGYKKKKESTYVMLPNAHRLISILLTAPKKPIAVLSADIHNYQDIVFQPTSSHVSQINQIIVGTGGATLDALPDKMNIPGIHVLAAQDRHGFIRVNGITPEGSLDYEFISASNSRASTIMRSLEIGLRSTKRPS